MQERAINLCSLFVEILAFYGCYPGPFIRTIQYAYQVLCRLGTLCFVVTPNINCSKTLERATLVSVTVLSSIRGVYSCHASNSSEPTPSRHGFHYFNNTTNDRHHDGFIQYRQVRYSSRISHDLLLSFIERKSSSSPLPRTKKPLKEAWS